MTIYERAKHTSIEVAAIIVLMSVFHTLAGAVVLCIGNKNTVVKIMLGEKAAKDAKKVPFSGDTIQKRFLDLSESIKKDNHKEDLIFL